MSRDQNNNLVKYVAERIFVMLNEKAMSRHSIKLDDLISAGASGLQEATEAFNPEDGQPFEIFSRSYIRKAIFDMLRNVNWTPPQSVN